MRARKMLRVGQKRKLHQTGFPAFAEEVQILLCTFVVFVGCISEDELR